MLTLLLSIPRTRSIAGCRLELQGRGDVAPFPHSGSARTSYAGALYAGAHAGALRDPAHAGTLRDPVQLRELWVLRRLEQRPRPHGIL